MVRPLQPDIRIMDTDPGRIKHWAGVNLRRLGLNLFKKQQIWKKIRLPEKKMEHTVSDIKRYSLLIDGTLGPSGTDEWFSAVDPSTDREFARLADGTAEDMDRSVDAAFSAHKKGAWRALAVAERGVYLKKTARLIREKAKELAEIECRDVGKTIKHTTFIDVPTCADTFEYFGGVSEDVLKRNLKIDAPVASQVLHEPMGVVGCLIPWNYPMIMTAWKLAPALLAGNCVVLRPSSTASASVMRLAQILKEAGFPDGVVNIVSSRDSRVAAKLVASKKVAMVSFTGGTATGQEIMRQAAGTNKKLTLELGGKSPNIVFGDCDFEAALGGAMSAIFMNQGQMCTAGSRLLLEDTIYDRFLEALVCRTKKLKIGPAKKYDTDFGPLVSETHRKNVLDFVEAGKQEGARLLCGGVIPHGPDLSNGFYIEPAIFADVDNTMTIAREEIFGPVLCVMRFSSEEEAVRLANDTRFGLAAMMWTKDGDKAKRVAGQLQCGTVWINTYGAFYNEAPYGGYKASGFGRELGLEGLLEYTQTKHICRDTTPGGRPLVSSWF